MRAGPSAGAGAITDDDSNDDDGSDSADSLDADENTSAIRPVVQPVPPRMVARTTVPAVRPFAQLPLPRRVLTLPPQLRLRRHHHQEGWCARRYGQEMD